MGDSNNPPPYDEAIKKPPVEGFPPNPSGPSAPYIPHEGHSQMHHSASAPQANVSQPPPSVIYMAPNAYGPRPTNVICPHCQQQVLTRVRPVAGLLTWLLCLLLIIFGCTLGCCLIPFCVDDCQDVEHICPNCNSYLNQYKRIGN
ncbi:Lipopolysaccharide-induced tumor necrosis factor-alpha factor-like protein [Aphelenchoides bicaudatus]|nr:Lipopolysaccharide-induced tumor necrosis factor-alpha factor-like protein [Aphelenchoides bicaudatus]